MIIEIIDHIGKESIIIIIEIGIIDIIVLINIMTVNTMTVNTIIPINIMTNMIINMIIITIIPANILIIIINMIIIVEKVETINQEIHIQQLRKIMLSLVKYQQFLILINITINHN